jgi:hypothetical protein
VISDVKAETRRKIYHPFDMNMPCFQTEDIMLTDAATDSCKERCTSYAHFSAPLPSSLLVTTSKL